MTEKQNIFWNQAAKSGLILGAITTGYYLINLLISSLEVGALVKATLNILSLVLWGAKIYYCLKVLKTSMQKYSLMDAEADNSKVFRFGMAVAALSALIAAAVSLCDILFIHPDALNESLEILKSTEGMTESMISMMEDLIPAMPNYTFFVNLIYCFLFGTIASAIYSRNIPSTNPFNTPEE